VKRGRPKKKKITSNFTYNLMGTRYTLTEQAHIVAAAKAAYHRIYGGIG